ncbi:piriformospora indica-insensitive protein 2-like [Coffea arabica]|uniref:Piriformospora indica-insensitive protein 2-like n=1 Tax=Coffea arabica TaxID=13443 RepID=A0A6P6UZ19_COFAR|nr:piriformospora indica-insensitive protein 2-like [Coffea arabica]
MMKVFASSMFFILLCILHMSFSCSGQAAASISIAAPMEKAEQEALYSTIQSFVGKWWNGSDLYPDPCGWTPIQGVSCDLSNGLWYVTSLDIGPVHDNSLNCAPNADFGPHLFALKHLKSLSFFNCFVSPHHLLTIPTDKWESLADSLESLEFRSNPGLVGQIPATFGGLKNLQSLVLIQNGLSSKIPTDIGNLSNLKRLVLSQNQITGKIPDSLGSLSGLLILDLSRNLLSGPLPHTLGKLTSLLKLDLSSNQLAGSIQGELRNLKNLTLLDLSRNRFSGGLTKSFQEMSSVEELVLSNNPVGGDIMSLNWQNLKCLLVLDLSNMSLTGGIPDSIAELKRLRFLGLNDNNLAGDIPPRIGALPNISAIYLNGNYLTGELKFSELFYGKMGRRFGAWNNTNLCYPIELKSTGHAPYGVKPCHQEATTLHENISDLDEKSNLGKGDLNHDSHPTVSLAFPSFASNGLCLCYIFLCELFMIALDFSLTRFAW